MPSFPPFTTLLETSLSHSTTGDICPESSSLEQQSLTAHDVAPLESLDFVPSEAPAHTSPPTLRRSTRVKYLPSHLQDFHCFHAFATLQEPHSYREASTNPLWQDVMKEDLMLYKTTIHGIWKSVVGCKWEIKTCSDGTVDKYKALLVARGFTEEYGVDFEETFAHVAHLFSVRALLVVAASRHWSISQMDVKNAFLNGYLNEKVYMQPPLGLSSPRTRSVVSVGLSMA